MLNFLKNEEKKVEYIELIYDLIFVYIIGRNNSLVQHVSGGFLDWELYLTYIFCTLITIQIWYNTTLFINRYGDGSFSEYIGLFINMYLLYYMASGTQEHWGNYFYRYNVAWMLILLNQAVQYLVKKREIRKTEPWKTENIRQYVGTMMIQIGIIALGIILYSWLRIPLTPLAMVFGIVISIAGRKRTDLVAVDFAHLTERVMLYIVFTFGEMIIAIASYFNGRVTFSNIYFSLMAFLIVAGLFMSYGFMYDRILDRDMSTSGSNYMIIHIFIIFALSNLTNALEFMREDNIALLPKNIYLIASFACYYIFLFMTGPFTRFYKSGIGRHWTFLVSLVVFIALMLAFYRNGYISIAISAAFTFLIWFLEYQYWKKNIDKCMASGLPHSE